MKSFGIEDVMADALQFPVNGVGRGDSSGPIRPGLQGSDLLGGCLDDVAEEKQQGFLAFPRIQQRLHGFTAFLGPGAASQRNGWFIKYELVNIRRQKRSFQSA
jgi:hypothetical protein